MTSQVSILKIETNEQWEELRSLSKELQLFEQSIRPERKPFSTISEGSFRYMQRNVAEKNGIALLAVNTEGDAIGFMTAWMEDSDGLDQGHGKVGEISDAYIKPAYRNAYTFKKMGQITAAHFKELGLDRLSFQTLATNTRMQDLFITLGFKPHKVSFEIKLDGLI
ncbi:MAG TPA: GNAT family N-acetyltransferase [Alphaproteobacteria bacterium]